MQSQPNHQYLRYSCSCGESDIARLQQRQHVIVSISLANRCFVLAETGIFATNRPFGNVAFSAGIAVEFGRPKVIAETEPQEAIVIAGLLS